MGWSFADRGRRLENPTTLQQTSGPMPSLVFAHTRTRDSDAGVYDAVVVYDAPWGEREGDEYEMPELSDRVTGGDYVHNRSNTCSVYNT